MRLRNKKTGEIGRLYFDHQLIDPKTGTYAIVIQHRDKLGYEAFANYFTLAELNEEWEDYKPAEPLIKDEKVRKAIRAFAELHDSKTITFEKSVGGASFISRADNGYSMLWVLGRSWGAENIEPDKPYSIAELCGEDEKCVS